MMYRRPRSTGSRPHLPGYPLVQLKFDRRSEEQAVPMPFCDSVRLGSLRVSGFFFFLFSQVHVASKDATLFHFHSRNYSLSKPSW